MHQPQPPQFPQARCRKLTATVPYHTLGKTKKKADLCRRRRRGELFEHASVQSLTPVTGTDTIIDSVQLSSALWFFLFIKQRSALSIATKLLTPPRLPFNIFLDSVGKGIWLSFK